jgi:hypothetical protein
MPRIVRSDDGEPALPETCDWGFFSGSHCGDISVWCFGGENDFSVCQQHWAQLLEIHSQIPYFSGRFYRAC